MTALPPAYDDAAVVAFRFCPSVIAFDTEAVCYLPVFRCPLIHLVRLDFAPRLAQILWLPRETIVAMPCGVDIAIVQSMLRDVTEKHFVPDTDRDSCFVPS